MPLMVLFSDSKILPDTSVRYRLMVWFGMKLPVMVSSVAWAFMGLGSILIVLSEPNCT